MSVQACVCDFFLVEQIAARVFLPVYDPSFSQTPLQGKYKAAAVPYVVHTKEAACPASKEGIYILYIYNQAVCT